MLRIVHTADCHLDAPCASLDAGVRERVRAAEREAFARVCSLAIEREAHALVIAGDVFERSEAGPAALHHVLAQLARVTESGIAVVIASGNHDPGRALAPLAQAGCTLALTHEPVTVELKDADGELRGHIVAIGHSGTGESANLAQLLPPAPSAASVAVLHAQVDGATGARERYAPCTPEDLDRGYAYWRSGMSICASRCAPRLPRTTPAVSRRTTSASPAPRARSSSRSTPPGVPRSSS